MLIGQEIINASWSKTPHQVTQHLKKIENDLALLAFNISQSNQTRYSGLGFSLVCVPSSSRSHQAVEISIVEAQVRLISDTDTANTSVYAALVNLPENAMSLLIPHDKKDIHIHGTKHETMTLFPDAPYISAGSATRSGEANQTNSINFTFQISEYITEEEEEYQSESLFGRSVVTDLEVLCSFVDITKQRFSQVGCQYVPARDSRNVTCSCNHTTMFAVLLTASVIDIPKEIQVIRLIGVFFRTLEKHC